MKNLRLLVLITISSALYSCTNQQVDSPAFTASMLTSHYRATENLEENTNTALSQTKSRLEDLSRAPFFPIHLLAEQIDTDITALQLSVSKVQLLLEQGTSSTTKLQEPYLRLRTQLVELEQNLNNNYQQFFNQHQEDFDMTSEEVTARTESCAKQIVIIDDAWESLNLEWSPTQFKLMLAKTNLDLATIKNWLINDLSAVFGGRSF